MTDTRGNHLIGNEHIHEYVDRLRGTGGLPLSDSYKKSLKSWLVTLLKRGFLESNFVQNREEVEKAFGLSFPNTGSRSNFSRAVLQYFAALTDQEFAMLYPTLSRKEAVDTFRSIAAEANRGLGNRLGQMSTERKT